MRIYLLVHLYTDSNDFYVPEFLPALYSIHSIHYKRSDAENLLAVTKQQMLTEQQGLRAYQDNCMGEDDPFDHPDFDRVNTRLCQLEEMLNLQIIEHSIQNYQI